MNVGLEMHLVSQQTLFPLQVGTVVVQELLVSQQTLFLVQAEKVMLREPVRDLEELAEDGNILTYIHVNKRKAPQEVGESMDLLHGHSPNSIICIC